MLDLTQCVTMACLLDVIAPKPGNVHRGADFEDATFLDFAASAVAIGPVIARAKEQALGQTILQAVQARRSVTSTNTNLGIILLLSPLAGLFYWQKAGRLEQVFLTVKAKDESENTQAQCEVRLTAHRDELIIVREALQLPLSH